jgi:hypothetical protein
MGALRGILQCKDGPPGHVSLVKCYNTYSSYTGGSMKQLRTMVLSMRLPVESGKRLKRIAHRHGWTPSDASARLV